MGQVRGDGLRVLGPIVLDTGMQTFFESKKWKDSNAVDVLLYQAVYKSLDNTIAAIGKERFEKELSTFGRLKSSPGVL
jgi:hypothetical protein